MKKMAIFVGLLGVFWGTRSVTGATVTNVVSVGATAHVNEVVVVTTGVFLTADDSPVSSLDFQTVSAADSSWSTLAPAHIRFTIKFNRNWMLRLTTKNDAVRETTNGFYDEALTIRTWGYSYGGLMGQVKGALIPFSWRTSTQTVVGVYPPPGDPTVPTHGWTFVKDQNDLDNPQTPKDDPNSPGEDTKGDESFAAANTSGYCNVAFGNGKGTEVIDPIAKDENGDPVISTHLNAGDPFKVFIEGDFAGASATDYSTVLIFDLITT